MRRARQPARHDSHHLPELVHQPFLGVEPPRGIHDHGIESARRGGVDGVEGHGRGIAARRARHAGHAEPIGPDLELADCARPIRVGRREEHLPAFALQPPGQLGRGGGLAGAVDTDDQDDGRTALTLRDGARIRRAVEHGGKPALERLPEVVLRLERSLPHFIFQRLRQLHGGGHAEVRLDEDALHAFEVLGVEPPHERADVGEREPFDSRPQALVPILHSAVGHAES